MPGFGDRQSSASASLAVDKAIPGRFSLAENAIEPFNPCVI
jgi:hypothetical protein